MSETPKAKLFCPECGEQWIDGAPVCNCGRHPVDENGVPAVECQVFSRIVGYIRPVRSWNTAKVEEFKVRKNYEIKEIE